jgi:uncharacterized membrane protein YeaQ/YmgE (transglycosylase-associated protein family)
MIWRGPEKSIGEVAESGRCRCLGRGIGRIVETNIYSAIGNLGRPKAKIFRLTVPMLHIVWYIILGFIAGFVARLILHTQMSFLLTSLLGIVGSILGGLIARLFSRPRDGALFHPAGLILSIIGALIVLYVFNKVGPHYHWSQLLH